MPEMAKFKFSLETILKVNKLRKKQTESEFTTAQAYLNQQYKILVDMYNELNLITDDMVNMAVKGTSVHIIRMYADYVHAIRQNIRQQEQIVKRAENHVEEIKARLVNLIKRINVLSELKENQYRDYIFELEKRYQKTIDEYTGYKLYRQGGYLNG